uniref:Uncharacterized protein n=1 Tax=Meloidogyne hapla TaxID=6305 RepID=A0A1I8BMT7_MELHA
MEHSTFNSTKNSISNKNDVNNGVCRKYGNQLEKTTNNYFNFPSTVSPKWKPRLTLPALLPVLEQLRTTHNNISLNICTSLNTCTQKENSGNSPCSPQPSTPSYLSRSQSVASRCQASPDVLRDLSLRSFGELFITLYLLQDLCLGNGA